MSRPKKVPNSDTGWSTHEELKFLEQLGSHAEPPGVGTREVLLAKYERAMSSRVTWEHIDPVSVAACVAKMRGRDAVELAEPTPNGLPEEAPR